MVFAFFLFLAITSYDYDFLGIMGSIIIGCGLFLQIILISSTSYDYNMFVAKRNAFESTLLESRKSGNPYETAAIVKEVSEWNIKLAEHKYDNKNRFLGQYIDDRIETLTPIK